MNAIFTVFRCEQWWPEITHHCPHVQRVLVGLKTDLRDEAQSSSKTRNSKFNMPQQHRIVTTDEGEAMAAAIGATRYIEVSSLLAQNVALAFEEAIRTARGLYTKKHRVLCGCLPL